MSENKIDKKQPLADCLNNAKYNGLKVTDFSALKTHTFTLLSD